MGSEDQEAAERRKEWKDANVRSALKIRGRIVARIAAGHESAHVGDLCA